MKKSIFFFSRKENVSPPSYRKVVPIEQQLAEQLQALPPRDVVLRVEQVLVVAEHFVVVLLEEFGAQQFVPGQQLFERGEGIGGDVKGGHFDVAEKVKELVRVEHDLGQGLVAGALAQHRATVQRNLLVFVAAEREGQQFLVNNN